MTQTPFRLSRRDFSFALMATGLAAPLAAPGAWAQAKYPDRPVRVILPFGPGGVADVTARLVAQALSEKLGQNFVIENMPGAGGITAARAALSGGTDGYTLTLLTNGTAISVPLFNHLPFDPLKEFTPISTIGTFTCDFMVNAASPYQTLGDFLKAAKEKPGTLNVGTINVGSTQNLSAELFKTAAGVDFAIIPYRGTPEIQVGLLQGNVALMIDSYSSMKGNIASGKLRALASSGPKRSEATPDIATVAESGVAGYDVVSWNALFAPAATPPEIIKTLNDALKEILADADVKKRMLDLGIEARASTPQEISDRLKADIEKWGKVIDKAGIPKQ